MLTNLYGMFLSQKMTPKQIMDEFIVARNTLAASGADVFAGNKTTAVRQNTTLSPATARDAQPCAAYNGRGVVVTKTCAASGRYSDERGRNYGGHGRGGRRGGGHANASSEWGRGSGRGAADCNQFCSTVDRVQYSEWTYWKQGRQIRLGSPDLALNSAGSIAV